MADIPPRRMLPEGFTEEPSSIGKPSLSLVQITKMTITAGLFGPEAAAWEYVSDNWDFPNVVETVRFIKDIITIVLDLVTLIEKVKPTIGDSQEEAIKRIAAALGNPAPNKAIPVTGIANVVTLIRRGLVIPKDVVTGTPSDERYFVDEFVKKKIHLGVEIHAATIPYGYQFREGVDGERSYYRLGFIHWKLGDAWLTERHYFNLERTTLIAPYPEVTDVDVYWSDGVFGTIDKITVELTY